MSRMRVWTRFFVPVFLACCCYQVSGQIGGTGSIQGTVTDPSGAAIPGATVTATNTATNANTAQQTSAAGLYTIAALAPGQYTVSVSATGFQKVTQQHVTVDALAVVTVNLTLQLGQVGETVTVSSAPPPLDTADSTLGSSMPNQLYMALPLAMNGSPRDPTAFVALVPGVQGLATQAAGTSYASFNGGQPYLNEIYVEGIPQTNAAVQGETRTLSLGVSVEAVEQFQVETNDPPAMYEGQGVENYVLKSGTNEFHGSAYEFFRNTLLDARGFFPPTTPVEKQNEFGVNVGGPIKKNKIFFFGSYDGYYYRQGSTPTYQSVPTTAERQGDFSAFPQTIYNPYSTACNSSGGGCTRSPFPGNMIPSSLISPVSKSLQSYLPTPTNSAIQNNFLTGMPIGLHVNNTTDKLDFNLSDKHRFYGFYSHGLYVTDPLAGISAGTDALPLPYTASRIVKELPTSAQVHDVYIFSPSLLNQLSYSFSRLYVPILSATAGGAYPQKAGLQGLPAGQASLAFPTVNFSGPNTPISWGTTNSIAFDEAINTYVLQDNVQWVRGKHSMTIGGQIQWLQDNYTSPDLGSNASFSFSNANTAGFTSSGALNTATGNPYASYLLGAVNSASIVQNYVATIGARYKDYALYFQDDFKVNSKLTLNLGLRYDILGTFHEVANRMSFLNPALPNPAVNGYPGALQFAGYGVDSCHCATPVPPHYLELGPRFGLAYQVNGKTVIRGGYAIMYAHGGGTSGRGGGRNGTGQLGYNANPTFSSPNSGAGAPAFFWSAAAAPMPAIYSGIYAGGVPPYQQPPFFDPSLNTGFCTGCPAAGSITYGDPQIGGKPPYFENWNFGIQRAITSDMTLTLAYSASNGHFLATSVGRGIWSGQIDPRYLALGNLLNANATSANIAAANAVLPGIHLPYANYSGPIGQMLRPFPQYSGITDIWGDIGNSTYHSLQAVLSHRTASGLTFNLAYTYSKEIDDVLSSAGRTAYNASIEKAVGTIDRPNVFSGTFSYQLPFGKRRWASSRAFVNGMIADWELSGIATFSSGAPLTIISTACNVPYAGSECLPNYNPAFTGPVTINGGMGSGQGNLIAGPGAAATSYIAKAAFLDPAPYTFGNASRTLPYGLRSPSTWDIDLTVRRRFSITERVKLIFAADAFNIFNVVQFGGITANMDSANFGQATTQANSARRLQLDARINF